MARAPGRFRGGLGLVRRFRLDAPRGNFTANLDRFVHPPYGLEGGEPGAVGKLTCRRSNGEIESLPSKVTRFTLNSGDIIRLQTAGGGGFGAVNERSPQAIASDLEDGYVTVN